MQGAVFATPPARALGHRFSVSTSDAALTSYLRQLFGALPADPGPPHRRYQLTGPDDAGAWHVSLDGQPLLCGGSPAHILATLLWRINLGAIEDTDHLLLLHAGAVALGHVHVLLPGDTEVGKSTLVTGLLRAGAGYLGDEVVGVDLHADEMYGYPKAVSLDPGSWPLFPELEPVIQDRLRPFIGLQWHVPPRAIGNIEVVRRGRPDIVVFPSFQQGAGTRLERVGGAAALGLLAGCAFDTAIPHRRRLERLARLVEQVPCFRLTSGDLGDAVAVVRALADAAGHGRPQARPDAVAADRLVADAVLGDGTDVGAGAPPSSPAGVSSPVAVCPGDLLSRRLRRRAHASLVRVEGEAVAFVDHRGPLHGLNATGLLVWERLDGERPLVDVVDALAGRYGRPRGDVAEEVAAFVTSLLANGLVEPADA